MNANMRIRQGLLLLAILGGCAPLPPFTPPTPEPFQVDYSRIARATIVPVTPAPTVTPGGEVTVRFARDVLPIFQQNCLGCHGGIAGMWLTDYDHVILPSSSGPTLFAGEPERSPLYTYVRDGLMPANGTPLSAAQVELIGRWIAEGALNN